MNWDKFLRFKGLGLATCALLVLFLGYLVLNSFMQSKAVTETVFASSVIDLTGSVQQNLSATRAQELATQFDKLRNGEVLSSSGLSDNHLSLAKFLNNNNASLERVDAIVNALGVGNFSAASELSTQLGSDVKRQHDRKTALSKYLQLAAAILAILFYVLVILPSIGRISDQEEVEQVAGEENKGIMSTVSDGLFLLDQDHEIGVEQSASLKEMFKLERDLEGNFFDFISQFVPQSTVQTARDYLDLLFGDRVKEKLVRDLNPLNDVEISLVRRDGSYENRYLDFKFNRVVDDGDMRQLLVSVTDQTRRVLVERELEEIKEEKDAEIDLLLSILHVDKGQLSSFFDNAQANLTQINQTLEAKGHGDRELREKIKEIARVVHTLKGDASALGLHKFEFHAHAFEQELVDVRNDNETIDGKLLLPAIQHLKTMFSELSKMENLVGKLSDGVSAEILSNDASADQSGSDLPVLYKTKLQNLVDTVCERTQKRAHLSAYGFNSKSLPTELSEDLQSIAVQLIRNSIVHGALLPEERLAKGKSDFINIVASVTQSDAGYQLIVRDDGEAFDDSKIVQRALTQGLITPEQASKATSANAMRLIFLPGFSSLEEAGLDAGRGVGLDAVHAIVKEWGGSISVQHKQGKFCQFKFSIPKK